MYQCHGERMKNVIQVTSKQSGGKQSGGKQSGGKQSRNKQSGAKQSGVTYLFIKLRT